jgi:hypothetical protein
MLKFSDHTSKPPALTLRRRRVSIAERVPKLSNHVDVHCGIPSSLISGSLMSVGARSFSRPVLLGRNLICAFFFIQVK